MFRALLHGAAAGAAGTTALNAATYVDVAARARPSSETPVQAVERISQLAGQPIPGEGKERENRLSGLGPLLGITTGVAVGMLGGLLRPLIVRLPLSVGTVLFAGVAMAASDLPLAKLGIVEPKTWSRADWVSDAVPHLAYGAVACATLRATGNTA